MLSPRDQMHQRLSPPYGSHSSERRTDDGGRDWPRLEGGVEGDFAGVGARNLEFAALYSGSTGVEALDMFSWLWDQELRRNQAPKERSEGTQPVIRWLWLKRSIHIYAQAQLTLYI